MENIYRDMNFKNWLLQQEVNMIPEHAIKVHVKNVEQQKDYTCGAAALRAVLLYYGIKITEREVEKLAKTTESGTDTSDLIRAARQHNLKTKTKHNMDLHELKEWLDKKRPVIICLQQRGDEKKQKQLMLGHYMVVIGYDEKYLYFQDPSLRKGFRGRIEIKEFMKRWKDSTAEGVIRFRWGLALWKDDETPVYPNKISKVRSV